MTSFASIDRIEGNYAVCEVELLPFEESKPEDFATKECRMMDISLQDFPYDIGEVNEVDVFVVEHDGENIIKVYYKDAEEKARRLEVLAKIWRQ